MNAHHPHEQFGRAADWEDLCSGSYSGYVCTRAAGHEGPCVAHGELADGKIAPLFAWDYGRDAIGSWQREWDKLMRNSGRDMMHTSERLARAQVCRDKLPQVVP